MYKPNISSDGRDTSDLIFVQKIDPFVSEECRRIFQYVGYGIFCQAIGAFGTVTNIVNIVCFVKMGFKDPVNVSLLGLAVADLLCLGTIMWLNICILPIFQEANFPFDQVDIQYLTAAYPHIVFTRITSWITALITLERCLCIAMPLKVTTFVTPKRVAIVIASTFIFIIGGATPFYGVNVFSMKYHPGRNRTVVGLIRTHNRRIVEIVLYAVNNIILPFGAFGLVIVCTATLVFKLQRKTKWRQAAASSISECMVSRDQKVTRMVLMISSVFIFCFIPTCFIFIGMTAEPELSIDGKYHNIFIVIFGFGFILESINSAVNIFIYYRMSSKFRLAFRQIFRLRVDEKPSFS